MPILGSQPPPSAADAAARDLPINSGEATLVLGNLSRMGQGDAESERDTGTAVVAAVPVIIGSLAANGVTDVQWFLAFHGYPVVWLVTTSDAEKAVVAEHGFFRAEVLSALAEAGVAPDLLERVHVTVESQETVDRDFEGSWFYAMR